MDTHIFPLSALIAALAISALAALAAPACASPPAPARSDAHNDDRVVIYRCTDGQGRLALRDSPCRSGERQDIRTMPRPKDAPIRPPATQPAQALLSTAKHGASPPPQIIFLQNPRPLYECSGPDGIADDQRYLSDTPEGKLRWVPRPTGTVPIYIPVYTPSQNVVQISDNSAQTGYQPAIWQPLVIDNGDWVRDTCYALPPADACERLRDERGNLGRRRFNAQPTERAEINREERRVEARIAQDCR
jgi:hypothetical protein